MVIIESSLPKTVTSTGSNCEGSARAEDQILIYSTSESGERLLPSINPFAWVTVAQESQPRAHLSKGGRAR
jgi:hypothetical protein